MADESLLALAADIISAHVGNNAVASDQLPQLIETVYASLAGLGKAPEPVAEERVPAVSIRASVKPDGIVCLECGSKFKTIKRHLTTDHQLSVDEYRSRWNLPASYPTVAPDYAERRRELAKTIGLGRKKGTKVKAGNSAPTKTDVAPVPTSEPAVDAKAPLPVTAKAAKAHKAPVEETPPAPKSRGRKKLGISAA